jgi:heat shock protein HslJ
MSKLFIFIILCVAAFAGTLVYNAGKEVNSVYDVVDLSNVRTAGTKVENVKKEEVTNKPTQETPPPAQKNNSLEGSYKLVDVQGKKVLSERVYTLVIQKERILGQICNSYGSAYTVNKDTLVLDALVSTKMACADEAGDYERIVFDILGNTPNFSLKNNVLRLSHEGKYVLFRKE